jgi:UDPglucose 6-dehydrogenase
VIGSGYLGLVAASGFCELGHHVVSIDNDREKLDQLRQGRVPVYEEHLDSLIRRNLASRLTFSDDVAAAVGDCQVIFIAVGTPEGENGEADLSYVEAVSREIAGAINSYKVIVEKSTVPVYTSRWIRRSMLLNGAPAHLFDVVSNPEFLREGTAVVDFLYPDRIVIGGDNEGAVSLVRSIYRRLEDGSYYDGLTDIAPPPTFPGRTKIIQTGTASAELIKHASNAFLAMKISFINAVASICEAVGADVSEVACGIGSDSRIGAQFLRPGIGYGGSCFPKDLKAFRAVARDAGYDFRLLDEVALINDEQRARFLRKVRGALWTLKGKKLAVLGISFKGGTDDIRDSPALPIIRALAQEGCQLSVYDPVAMDRGREVLADCQLLQFASSPYQAAQDADAVVVLTDWAEFAMLDLGLIRASLKYHLIIDGRNLYDPATVVESGLGYVSVGRADVFPENHPVTHAPHASRTAAAKVRAVLG